MDHHMALVYMTVHRGMWTVYTVLPDTYPVSQSIELCSSYTIFYMKYAAFALYYLNVI